MHVVFACHRYFPVPGGSERIAQLLAEGVVRAGHRATMVTQREPGVPATEELNGVSVLRIPTRRLGGIRFPSGYLRTLRETQGDLFHLHGNRIWCADFYLPFARRFRWPQVQTGHGFYQYSIHPHAWDRWYFERYFPRRLRGIDRYVCDTEFERRQLLNWGVSPDRLERIPLGAVTEEFRPQPEAERALRATWEFQAPNVAVYAGGFFENKRVDRLIDAVAATQGRWALLAIGRDVPGSPWSRSVCLERARRAGIEFRAPGELSRAETVRSIRAGDAVVSASDYEGFGVTLAEAMAAGTPFVSYPSGAAPEMAATGSGLLVSSVEEFSSALSRLEEPSVRGGAKAAAARAAPDWSEAAMLRRYLSLYERLAASR